MRRYRLQNREGDRAEVRLDGITLDGELHGDPLRVYAHLLPPKAATNAEEAEDAVLHLLRALRASGLSARFFQALWLPQLTSLSFEVQYPDDADCRALVDAAPRLAHLEKLTVSSSLRPPEGLHPRLEITKRL